MNVTLNIILKIKILGDLVMKEKKGQTVEQLNNSDG